MADTLYADQVTNISIHGGIVRLELAVVDELPKTKTDQVKLRVTHHLVMPMDAFVKAFEIQQAVVNKMLEEGVVKRRPDGAAGN